jgi:hypothetical protein
VILYRNMWLRELSAMVDGRPLKQWQVPKALTTQTGVTPN